MRTRHTGALIQQRVEGILSKFGITLDQINTITTDNGSNVIVASREMLRKAAETAREELETLEENNLFNVNVVVQERLDSQDSEESTDETQQVTLEELINLSTQYDAH